MLEFKSPKSSLWLKPLFFCVVDHSDSYGEADFCAIGYACVDSQQESVAQDFYSPSREARDLSRKLDTPVLELAHRSLVAYPVNISESLEQVRIVVFKRSFSLAFASALLLTSRFLALGDPRLRA